MNALDGYFCENIFAIYTQVYITAQAFKYMGQLCAISDLQHTLCHKAPNWPTLAPLGWVGISTKVTVLVCQNHLHSITAPLLNVRKNTDFMQHWPHRLHWRMGAICPIWSRL